MKKVKRLFEQFAPENYQLEIDIDKKNLKFNGRVIITAKKTGRPSQRITLHQKDLQIKSATIQKIDKKGVEELAVSRINVHKSYDEVRLHTNSMVYPGRYKITLEFSGKITDQMHGLYPCYFDNHGTKDWVIATQFEPNFARQGFPCIDEPEAKATYDLTIITPKGEVVLSNTEIKSQKTSGSKTTTVFDTTPVMSSYLLAWAAGDLHYVEAVTKDGIIMRSYATVAQPKSFLEYANKEAVDIIEFFADYFKTPFPLKKCDQIALPDFEVGAMENWGLITYREVALLADPVNRSQSSEQYVSMVVAHELSHQWFGNLVTMKWWDDLWLNESFASLMEHIALDVLHPDWHQWEQYTSSDVIACSSRDIYKDVQAVRVDVRHPDEITTLFDPAIVYAKGGRLLKMLMEYIGEDSWRAGLKNYFASHAYKNTTRDDLWEELALASGKDIHALMNPWLEQSGQAQLDVEHSKDTIKLSQKRFVLDADDDKTLWPIPLLSSQSLSKDILINRTDELPRLGKEPVVFNSRGSAHAIVRYTDEPTRGYIEKSMVTQEITPESRINILNDYIMLARSGDLSILEALEIVQQCANEPRDAVWQQITRVMGTVYGLTEGDKQIEDKIKALRRHISDPHYSRLGWNDQKNDDPNTKGLRQTMLALQVHGEAKDVVDEAVKRYKSVKKVDDLPAEQRGLIIGAMVRSDSGVVDDLMKQYQTTPNPDAQHGICGGLCSTKDPEAGQHIINEALGEKGFVRPQDIFRWYAFLMRNRYTREQAWNWLTSNWLRLEKIYGGGKSLDNFIVYAAGPLNTEQWQKKFSKFFEPKMTEVALERNIKIALSEIEARVAWRTREEPKIQKYFSAK